MADISILGRAIAEALRNADNDPDMKEALGEIVRDAIRDTEPVRLQMGAEIMRSIRDQVGPPDASGNTRANPGSVAVFSNTPGVEARALELRPLDPATVGQVRSGQAGALFVSPGTQYEAEREVAVPYEASVDLDFATFINARVVIEGDITIGDALNPTPGKSGYIVLWMDGDHSVSWAGGSNIINTGSVTPEQGYGGSTVLRYRCLASGNVAVWQETTYTEGALGVPVITSAEVTSDGLPGLEGDELYIQNLAYTGDLVTISYQWKADGSDLSGETSETFTPGQSERGQAITCLITATNSSGSDDYTTTTDIIVGIAPTYDSGLSDQTLNVGASYSLDVAPNFEGGGLTFSATNLPAGVSISIDGEISGTPTATQGAGSVTITATNDFGSVDATIDFTVEAASSLPAVDGANSGSTWINGGSGGTTLSVPSGAANSRVFFALACDGNLNQGSLDASVTSIFTNLGGNSPAYALFYADFGASPPATIDVPRNFGRDVAAAWLIVNDATGAPAAGDSNFPFNGTLQPGAHVQPSADMLRIVGFFVDDGEYTMDGSNYDGIVTGTTNGEGSNGATCGFVWLEAGGDADDEVTPGTIPGSNDQSATYHFSQG